MKLFFFCLFLLISHAQASVLPTKITGKDYSGLNKELVEIGDKKAIVVVFLSAKCPCSNSHIEELLKLNADFPDFSFVGIHSNMDEPDSQSETYFKKLKLSFPVLQDVEAKYADQFAAFKTPHTFVLSQKGEVLYQGGVSNSHDIKKSDKLFLREALEDISKGQKIRNPEGRTLGCFIVRKKNNVL
jgi:peroxiredoxin